MARVFIVVLCMFAAEAYAGTPSLNDTQERLKIMLLESGVGVLAFDSAECLSIIEETDLVHEQHAVDFTSSNLDNYGFMSIFTGGIQSLNMASKRKTEPDFMTLYYKDRGAEISDVLMHLAHLCGVNEAAIVHDHHW